jgi:hypothetical protein
MNYIHAVRRVELSDEINRSRDSKKTGIFTIKLLNYNKKVTYEYGGLLQVNYRPKLTARPVEYTPEFSNTNRYLGKGILKPLWMYVDLFSVLSLVRPMHFESSSR